MIISIPDDYHGVVSTLECLETLSGHEVRIHREAAPPFEVMVENLRHADIIVRSVSARSSRASSSEHYRGSG